MNILFLSYIMDAYCVKLRYHKMHIYIYIYIELKAQLITNIYLNKKNLEFNN